MATSINSHSKLHPALFLYPTLSFNDFNIVHNDIPYAYDIDIIAIDITIVYSIVIQTK